MKKKLNIETLKPEDIGLKCLTKKQIRARDKLHIRQRKKWGFCDADLWNLDYTIAKFILPRLVRYRKMSRMGHPANLSMKQWGNILDKMIAAFKILKKGYKRSKSEYTKEIRIVKRGLELFAKWFEYLWD